MIEPMTQEERYNYCCGARIDVLLEQEAASLKIRDAHATGGSMAEKRRLLDQMDRLVDRWEATNDEQYGWLVRSEHNAWGASAEATVLTTSLCAPGAKLPPGAFGLPLGNLAYPRTRALVDLLWQRICGEKVLVGNSGPGSPNPALFPVPNDEQRNLIAREPAEVGIKAEEFGFACNKDARPLKLPRQSRLHGFTPL
jgi:hypothetical protein